MQSFFHVIFFSPLVSEEQGLETERRNATALADEMMTLKAALQVCIVCTIPVYASLWQWQGVCVTFGTIVLP